MRKIVIFLLLSAVAVAADHAPLPKKLFEAKTIYIDNQSGYAEIGDKCYQELKKWGRFTIIEDSEKADMVFWLGSSEKQSGFSAYTQTYSNGAATTSISPDTTGKTILKAVDPKTGAVLWTDSRVWRGFHSATKGVVKDLRKRMEEQERK